MDRVREAVCDITQPEQVEQMLAAERPQMLLHLAGLNAVADSWREPIMYMNVNVMSTMHLLDSLCRLTLKDCRILIVGSMLSFRLRDDNPPHSQHPYSLSKTMQLLAARAWGSMFRLPVMVAQPSNMIGPGRSQGICSLIAAYTARIERGIDQPPFRLSSITEARDFVDVRDAVRAFGYILRLGTPGGVYPIGTGHMRTLGEVAVSFEAHSTAPITWRIGTNPNAEPMSFLVQAESGGPVDQIALLQSDPPPSSPINLDPIHSLGWQPLNPFERTLEEVLHFFRNEASQGQ
ncbi:nucleoside-diphosphate sugar epimerase [Paenibacillus popilliae ATCC 14706]|uniref:Nucleoside-diphosphate sugar epimerase n=1 Tax=Paenibacillus popilliae ATCC 14706 TaxID=1212764 RepID=M9M4X4_PAEPP|nr:nucleoside-diphosphate sugar epimerase [Paenibacillus popilliae ATCC 14706]